MRSCQWLKITDCKEANFKRVNCTFCYLDKEISLLVNNLFNSCRSNGSTLVDKVGKLGHIWTSNVCVISRSNNRTMSHDVTSDAISWVTLWVTWFRDEVTKSRDGYFIRWKMNHEWLWAYLRISLVNYNH